MVGWLREASQNTACCTQHWQILCCPGTAARLQTLWGWRGDCGRLAAPRARGAACCPRGLTGKQRRGPADPATLPSPSLGWMSPAARWIPSAGLWGRAQGCRAQGCRAQGEPGSRLGSTGRSSCTRVPMNRTLNWTPSTADLSACQRGDS